MHQSPYINMYHYGYKVTHRDTHLFAANVCHKEEKNEGTYQLIFGWFHPIQDNL